jgi:hypothetical protein
VNAESHLVAWFVSVPLIAFWLLCVVINPVLFVRREILKREGAPSLIPLVGGLFGSVGLHHFPLWSASR